MTTRYKPSEPSVWADMWQVFRTHLPEVILGTVMLGALWFCMLMLGYVFGG